MPEQQARKVASADHLLHATEIALRVRPRVFTIENVARARSQKKGKITWRWKAVRQRLQAAGYTVQEAIIDAAKMGVPQRRKRLFLIATLGHSGGDFEAAAEAAQTGPDTTLAEFFPDIEAYYHFPRGPKDCAIRPVTAPSPCLRTNCGQYPQPGRYVRRRADAERTIQQCRKFTVSELAKVQGWPASAALALPEGRTSACKIIKRPPAVFFSHSHARKNAGVFPQSSIL